MNLFLSDIRTGSFNVPSYNFVCEFEVFFQDFQVQALIFAFFDSNSSRNCYSCRTNFYCSLYKNFNCIKNNLLKLDLFTTYLSLDFEL